MTTVPRSRTAIHHGPRSTEKAPGAAVTATEGVHTETPIKGHEVTPNSMPDTLAKREARA